MLEAMRLVVVVAAALATTQASQLASTPPHPTFEQWTAETGRVYDSPHELALRRMVYTSNLARIDALNAANPAARYSVTRFADLTQAEFAERVLQPTGAVAPLASPAALHRGDDDAPAVAGAPESFDWRDHGYAFPSGRQGECSSSWAFAAISGIEGQLLAAGEPLFKLSEQQLLDCDKTSSGCHGGRPDHALAYIASKAGGKVTTEDTYPYTGEPNLCEDDKHEVAVTGVAGATLLCSSHAHCSEQDMAARVATDGPLIAGMSGALLQFYKFGIMGEVAPCPGGIDHWVSIIGYGHTTHHAYWIVRNSWGPTWGEHGTFRLLRNHGTCSINSYVMQVRFDKQA